MSERSGRRRRADYPARVPARCGQSIAPAGRPKQLRTGIVHQLQKVFAIEGEERCVHDFENAREQRGGFKRAHALFLQKIGESVDLRCQFPERVRRVRAACAEGVVSFAQRRHDVGECLQRAHQAFDKRGSDEHEIDKEAKQQQKSRVQR